MRLRYKVEALTQQPNHRRHNGECARSYDGWELKQAGRKEDYIGEQVGVDRAEVFRWLKVSRILNQHLESLRKSVHVGTNVPAFIFVLSPEIQLTAVGPYLLLSLIMAAALVIWAYRRGYGREPASQTRDMPLAAEL